MMGIGIWIHKMQAVDGGRGIGVVRMLDGKDRWADVGVLRV